MDKTISLKKSEVEKDLKENDTAISQDEEFGDNLLQQLMGLFIMPEVEKRQEAGELPKTLELRAAQIIFSDDKEPLVRINNEIKAIGKVKLKSGISKKVGDPIYEHEVEGLDEVNLTEEDDPNSGHATLVRIKNNWTIIFDLRYNRPLSMRYIKTAKEFFECAEFSFMQKHWHSLIDNLFSTAELIVKSKLISIPETKFKGKVSHADIQTRYNTLSKSNMFKDFGNIEIEFRNTFNQLSQLRNPARYLLGNLLISEDEARIFLDNIRNMID